MVARQTGSWQELRGDPKSHITVEGRANKVHLVAPLPHLDLLLTLKNELSIWAGPRADPHAWSPTSWLAGDEQGQAQSCGPFPLAQPLLAAVR